MTKKYYDLKKLLNKNIKYNVIFTARKTAVKQLIYELRKKAKNG